MHTYKRNIAIVSKTAVMLALLIGVQFISRSFGQFVTGSLVNLILLVSVFIIGAAGGLIVAFASPFLAFLAGIGPAFIQIVPFIAAGNAIFVLTAAFFSRFIASRNFKSVVLSAFGLLSASIAKTAFLWIGLVLLALPLIPGINEKQIAVISAAFTWPQLITAIIGSTLAMIIVPILKKALRINQTSHDSDAGASVK